MSKDLILWQNPENQVMPADLDTIEQVVVYADNSNLTEKQQKVSDDLKQLFPEYLNSLELKDTDGTPLVLDSNGEGTFKDYVFAHVIKSAEKELENHESLTRHPALRVMGSEVEKQDALAIEGNKVTAIDTDKFVKKITRMKPSPSFDLLDLKSPENEVFGDDKVSARHFTKYSMMHSETAAEMADDKIIKMLNPTRYIGEADTAKHWRIRHGAFDRDTSLAIPTILAVLLQNNGYNVDFFLPWGLPHSGDYDLPELFAWIDSLAK